MTAIDQPVEPRRQIVWSFYWLIGTLGLAFLAGCFLDFGVVIALPLIGAVSLIAWLALTVAGARAGWECRSQRGRGLSTVCASVAAAGLGFLVFLPVMRFSGIVQAHGILLLNQRAYQRDIDRVGVHEPLIWVYGGWLSTDRVIAFWPTGNPDQRLAAKNGSKSSVSCRWLRSSFYDCTIDY